MTISVLSPVVLQNWKAERDARDVPVLADTWKTT
jgi:hypothetical protein